MTICQTPGCGTPATLRPERNDAVLCPFCCLAVAVHAEAMVETLRTLAAEGRYADESTREAA
ncbi:MAG TPA: hypothetical protein VNJ48_13740 [Nocardioides sp.]|nr:hypothetical protein [Nocardioides sp.]